MHALPRNQQKFKLFYLKLIFSQIALNYFDLVRYCINCINFEKFSIRNVKTAKVALYLLGS